MEQRLYNYEIILNLLKGENHLRQIAKDLNMNHMTTKRILDSLVRGNVLDVKKQGKNNMFSIKNTLESQNIIFMAEFYKFNKFIRKHPELRKDMEKLKKMHAETIIIFGSYAKGAETERSDIDIYIDTSSKKTKKDSEDINKKLSVKIGKFNKESLLIKEIEKNHIIIKGVERFYEKSKFFV